MNSLNIKKLTLGSMGANCYIIENYTFDKLDVVLNAIFKTLSK